MAPWKEIEEFKRDPARARRLAKALLDSAMEWTDWEEPFLETMSAIRGPLTTRQAEKLLELRDAAKRVPAVKGFSVRSLFSSCWEARLDLDDDHDIEFLDKLRGGSWATLRSRDAG